MNRPDPFVELVMALGLGLAFAIGYGAFLVYQAVTWPWRKKR